MPPVLDQDIPEGLEVTMPVPAPVSETVSGKIPVPKVAETFLTSFINTLQEFEVPEQAPPHATNEKPADGVADKVTTAPVA